MMPNTLLTRTQVAEMIGVHAETIYRATKAGQLPAVYLGHRTIRYRREHVEQWLSRHQGSTRRPADKLAVVAG